MADVDATRGGPVAAGFGDGGDGLPGWLDVATTVAVLALSASTAWVAVTGPLAGPLASVAARVLAAGIDGELPPFMPWLLGFLVAGVAWSAWDSLACILLIPFLRSGRPLRARARDVAGNASRAALLLGLGAAALGYACHALASAGGDPRSVAAWVASGKGVDRLYDDPSGVVPAAVGIVACVLLQSGLVSALGVPGTAALLLARAPRGDAAGRARRRGGRVAA